MIETSLLIEHLEKLLSEARATATSVGRGPGGREIALTITNLQQAIHWAREARVELIQDTERRFQERQVQASSPDTQIVGREEFYANWQQTLDRMESSKASEGE